jgi:hypothetical protein
MSFAPLPTPAASSGSDASSAVGIRQQQDRLFYVSLFVEMPVRDHFRVVPPGQRVKLRSARLVPCPDIAAANAKSTLPVPQWNNYGRLALPARAKALWSCGDRH